MKKGRHFDVINHIKKVFYLVVLTCFSVAHAGSFEDFFSAIRQDDPAKITALLIRGFDPNTVDAAGYSGLMLAMKESSLKAAAALINWPTTRVEIRNAVDESPLMLAALKGETELCQSLIQRGADVNKPGWAPLHYAATNGHLAVISLLLEENAYIDASSPNGTTPLMMAAHYGDASAVKLLLEAGADPMLKNNQGLTAFDFATKASRTDSADLISAFVRAKQPKGTW